MPPFSRLARNTVEAPISFLMREALARPELISLAAGFVDQASLPLSETLEAVGQLLNSSAQGRAALQYSSTMGDGAVREALLSRLLIADGRSGEGPSVDQVIMTAGSNELLYQLGLILLDPDDIVLCAAPSYFVFLGALQGMRVHAVGLPVDEDGVLPEALDQTLKKASAEGDAERIKALYLTTYFDNPSSITTSQSRREQIFEIVDRHNHASQHLYIIEDAAYRDLRYFGDDIPSLHSLDRKQTTVIHTSSFSKSYSPGLRVGWGVLPKDLVQPLSNHQGNVNFGAPHFSQQVILKVVQSDAFESHLETLRMTYRDKLETMVSAAQKYLGDLSEVAWLPAKGGLYIWMQITGVNTAEDGDLFSRAIEKGVLFVPGCHCYPQRGATRQNDRIRLSFGVQSPERIERGMQLLSEAIRETLSKKECQSVAR